MVLWPGQINFVSEASESRVFFVHSSLSTSRYSSTSAEMTIQYSEGRSIRSRSVEATQYAMIVQEQRTTLSPASEQGHEKTVYNVSQYTGQHRWTPPSSLSSLTVQPTCCLCSIMTSSPGTSACDLWTHSALQAEFLDQESTIFHHVYHGQVRKLVWQQI